MVLTPDLAKVVAQRLALLRADDHRSQRELADACGVTLSVLNRAILGTGTPSPDALLKIADHYEVSLDWLMGRINGKPKRFQVKQLSAS